MFGASCGGLRCGNQVQERAAGLLAELASLARDGHPQQPQQPADTLPALLVLLGTVLGAGPLLAAAAGAWPPLA